MARQNLGAIDAVTSLLRTNSILVEVGGSIRRITLDKLIDSINAGDEQLLRSVAWGVPIKQATQSSPEYGRIGNLTMWEEYKSHCGRYLVKNNGHAAKLAKSNSGIYADGTTLDESIGHVMVKIPKLYYRVQTDSVTNIPYLWMSQIPIGGKYITERCVGAYKASMSGSALISRSGVAPAGSRTINAFFTAAQVNGDQWGLADYEFQKWLIMMQLSEYGNTNIQAKLGNGLTGTNSSDYTTPLSFLNGATKSLGDDFGAIAHAWTTSGGVAVQNATDVSVLGIENPYAQQWEMRQGIYCGSSGNTDQDGSEVFLYEGNRMPTNAELTTHPAGDYRQLTRSVSSGYIKTITLGDFFDIIPATVGGGSTENWCDNYWYANNGQLVLFGGSANDGAYCGLACAASHNAWSYSYSTFGSRLAYYGKLTEMFGAELVAE